MSGINLAQMASTLALSAIPVLLGITIHESAHGFMARHFGDMTAASKGRISLNPLKHIDPLGTIPLTLLVLSNGNFTFSYAKPVPVNFALLRNPKRDMIFVALAGPMSNFVQAYLWMLLWSVLYVFNVHEPFLLEMTNIGISVNLVLWAFNLFPVPPLDGGRILVGLLPYKAARQVASIEAYGFFIVMALVLVGIAWKLWMEPLIWIGSEVLDWLIAPMQFMLYLLD